MTDDDDPGRAAAAYWAFDPERTGRLIDESLRASEELIEVLRKWDNASIHQRAGRAAESWHTGTFNADAILKGLDVRAQTTATAGAPHAAADVAMTGGGADALAQIKSCSTPKANAAMLARPKYGGMQQVVPADQLGAVKDHAATRRDALTIRRPARASAFDEVTKRATDRMRAGGAESKPLTTEGSRDLAANPDQLTKAMSEGQWKRDLGRGAVSGAIVGGVLSAAVHGYEVAKGREDVGEAAMRVAVDTGRSAIAGAATSVGARAVSQGLARAGMSGLARSALPVAVAATAYDLGTNVVGYARGNISGEELAVTSVKSVATGAGGWLGAEAGAAIGTCLCPGVGTVVGGIIGGLLGTLGIGALFK